MKRFREFIAEATGSKTCEFITTSTPANPDISPMTKNMLL